MNSLNVPRKSIESRHVWSMVLALSFHLLVLAVFSIKMPWLKTPEIHDPEIWSRHAFEVRLNPEHRNFPVSADKKASAGTRQNAADDAVLAVENGRAAMVQRHLEESVADKKTALSAAVNTAPEKRDIRSSSKTDAEKIADALPIPSTGEDQEDDDDWIDLVREKIVASSNYLPSPLEGEVNAAIEFNVTLQDGGTVLTVEQLKASGNSVFDESILQAVRELQLNSSNSPVKVPSHFTFAIHMSDLLVKRLRNQSR